MANLSGMVPQQPEFKGFAVGLAVSAGIYLVYKCLNLFNYSNNRHSSRVIINGREVYENTIQGSGRVAEKIIALAAFNTISMRCIGNLSVYPDTCNQLTIEADDNLLDYFGVSLDNHALALIHTHQNMCFTPRNPIKFTLKTNSILSRVDARDSNQITLFDGVAFDSSQNMSFSAHDLSDIVVKTDLPTSNFNMNFTAKDSSKIKIEKPIRCQEFDCCSQDGAKIVCYAMNAKRGTIKAWDSGYFGCSELNVDDLVANCGDSGTCKITGGVAKTALLTAKDSGKFNAPNLSITESCKGTASDSGSISCKATGTVSIPQYDCGKFTNYGAPKQVKQKEKCK